MQYVKKDWLDATVAFYQNNQNIDEIRTNLDDLIKQAIGRQEAGAYDEAIEILDQALKQKPQYTPA